MARQESIALGGYYATPPHLIPRIAALLNVVLNEEGRGRHVNYMDPCAADGVTIAALANALQVEKHRRSPTLYTCELEATRHRDLTKNMGEIGYESTQRALRGDAFRVTFDRGDKLGVDVLYLNPPYDYDAVHGRLEQKFLDRFAPALAEDGVLLFVVPGYALKASAETLARDFVDLRCFRFPETDFASYKQVVLVGRRQTGIFEPDARLLDLVQGWAADTTSIPELPEEGGDPLYPVRAPDSDYSGGLSKWVMREVDVTALLKKVRPWRQSTRVGATLIPTPNILPELPVQDLLLRTYPVATPPRPAHIAAGIASGLFNGARIEPKDTSKLPSLLVKGVFDREYKTVEEKQNKHGEIRAVVQVQQPRLVTTVLDLSTRKYHVLGSSTEVTATTDISKMGVADLLQHYGDSLMAVMERQCPILYDPRRDADSIKLPATPRRLFSAQSHAVKAIVKLLGGPTAGRGARRGKAAILLGEIGSGKSTVALMSARTIGARRVLVMCPPHLLQSWTNEVAAVLPDAEVRILASVADVDAIASMPPDGRTIIAVLSREVGKLTHGWAGAGSICPKCGQPTPDVDLAKKRARCTHQRLVPLDDLARIAKRMANRLLPSSPDCSTVHNLLRSRFDLARISHYTAAAQAGRTQPTVAPTAELDQAFELLVGRDWTTYAKEHARALVGVLAVLGEAKIVEAVRRIVAQRPEYGFAYESDSLLRGLPLLLTPGSEVQNVLLAELREATKSRYAYSYSNEQWYGLDTSVKNVRTTAEGVVVGGATISWLGGKLKVHQHEAGSRSLVLDTFRTIARIASFGWGTTCGEPLFQAVPEPRRIALARYISRKHANLFDFLVLDEGHEYATDGSAQERSAHRLTAIGLPTVLMTGTIMNGYAASLFTNMWALSADFRGEFARDESPRFIDRYGYRKRIVEDRDKDGEIVEYGSNSDRVTRSERVIGNAPGILPLFLLRHLLPISVTLHKADLAIDLPPCRQFRHFVDPGRELKSRYETLKEQLVAQIKKDQFEPDLAGKLWGQLAELPSYLDRATQDVGNVDSGSYEIRYPESVGDKLVTSVPPFPKTTLLPKEEWMLDRVEQELSEGRTAMVFSWHVKLLPRLARLIAERIGEPVPILYADKVPTGKRQDWIDREVVRKGRRVLVTNPVAIQTGLNNLVHFASEIWMENPACNPVTYRQAVGRVDRIGQKIETRIHFPVYAGTLQEQLYDLLMKKVAVSVSTDGLDPESALQAAGVGEDGILTGMSIGKQLWSMLTEGTNVETYTEPVYHGGSPARQVTTIDLMDQLDAMATG